MKNVSFEIKARCASLDKARTRLRQTNPKFVGKDHQIDTYFVVPEGRLKLREGDIENSLIYYRRENQSGPKISQIIWSDTTHTDAELRNVLTSALDVMVVVDKHREIYFLNNIKIHLDLVVDLGTFIEIEALDHDGQSNEELEEQCSTLMRVLEISEKDLIKVSYSDLALNIS